MNRSSLAGSAKKQLIEQLVYFDECKVDFLNRYYPDFGKERERVDKVLGVYARTVEEMLAADEPSSMDGCVLIGSSVELRYDENGDKEQYTIVFPQFADPDRNRLSFLSPLGLQLLLARKGESYMLVVPSGEIEVAVDDTSYAGLGEIRA